MVDRERSKNRHHLDKGEVVQSLGEVVVKFQRNRFYSVPALQYKLLIHMFIFPGGQLVPEPHQLK